MHLTGMKVEHYRGIKCLDLALDPTTVLIGENNCGKTSILHALRACLFVIRPSGGASPFDEFDLHFADQSASPDSAPPIVITLTFEEQPPDKIREPVLEEDQPSAIDWHWPEGVIARLSGTNGVIAVLKDPSKQEDYSRVQLRVTGVYSKQTQEIEVKFDFLDAAGGPLPEGSRAKLSDLQQLRPLFYLSALRDSAKEFSRAAQFWSPFVKNSKIDKDAQREIERDLQQFNDRIINAHGAFKTVRNQLTQVQKMVEVGKDDAVSIDAVPTRVFDLLNRTQVNIASATGAKLPIWRHGDGTQSLSVLMLFDAFLKADVSRSAGQEESFPIVALEEPEAHLHPNAVRALWRTINDINGQKLIATHSGDFLSDVDLASIRRIYKVSGEMRVGMISKGLLSNRDQSKFEFLVRRTRGELFFARCWLLGEGETEAILFAGAARVLGLDLEQAGVRCVEYRLGDIDFFLDAANALGIQWHCLTDADDQGKTDLAKAIDRVPAGSSEENHISKLADATSIEPYLAQHGFLEIYEAYASPQKRAAKVTAEKGTPEYAKQIALCISDKPSVAHEIVRAMNKQGKVPPALENALRKAVELAGRN